MKNRDKYPQEWFDTIRPAVLKLANYKCEICGIAHRAIVYKAANGSYVECDEFMADWARKNNLFPFKIHLQASHKDQNRKNCSLTNLQALCPKCHLNYDRDFNKILRRMRGRQQGTNGGRAISE
jgi:hypothetical protein